MRTALPPSRVRLAKLEGCQGNVRRFVLRGRKKDKRKEGFAPEVVIEQQIEAGATWVACCLTGFMHMRCPQKNR